jgi:hypothetical protein
LVECGCSRVGALSVEIYPTASQTSSVASRDRALPRRVST